MALNAKGQQTTEWRDVNAIGIETARVERSPIRDDTDDDSENDDNEHVVYIKNSTLDQSTKADVGVTHNGDIQIPKEGSRVVIAYRPSERPIVLNQVYQPNEDLPNFVPGERIITHPLSDSTVHFKPDGTIAIDGDTDIVINGGSTKPVTDVTISSTNSEGGATSLNVDRSSNVYLPP